MADGKLDKSLDEVIAQRGGAATSGKVPREGGRGRRAHVAAPYSGPTQGKVRAPTHALLQ